MTGIHRGVHGRIGRLIPCAIYSHFKGHNINLYIVRVSKEPLVIGMMETVQQIVFFVFYSANRLRDLQAELELDEDEQAGMNNMYEQYNFSAISIHLFISAIQFPVSFLNNARPRENEDDNTCEYYRVLYCY